MKKTPPCSTGKVDGEGNLLELIYEVKASNRWEVGLAVSGIGFQQVSFVVYSRTPCSTGKVDDKGNPLELIYEVKASNRWEVGLTMSDKGVQQVSFVFNSIATTKVRVGSRFDFNLKECAYVLPSNVLNCYKELELSMLNQK